MHHVPGRGEAARMPAASHAAKFSSVKEWLAKIKNCHLKIRRRKADDPLCGANGRGIYFGASRLLTTNLRGEGAAPYRVVPADAANLVARRDSWPRH